MMIYVDGTDLLGYLTEMGDTLVARGSRDGSRENLARWLMRYCEAQGCRAILVFDGTELGEVLSPIEQHGDVKVLSLAHGGDARAEIAGPANRSAEEDRTLVVTDDARLARDLEHGKARVVSSARFVARVRRQIRAGDQTLPGEPDEKFTGLSDEEVNFWLGDFGDEG
jgi:predicted RNA-binding protein with PIN domain